MAVWGAAFAEGRYSSSIGQNMSTYQYK